MLAKKKQVRSYRGGFAKAWRGRPRKKKKAPPLPKLLGHLSTKKATIPLDLFLESFEVVWISANTVSQNLELYFLLVSLWFFQTNFFVSVLPNFISDIARGQILNQYSPKWSKSRTKLC